MLASTDESSETLRCARRLCDDGPRHGGLLATKDDRRVPTPLTEIKPVLDVRAGLEGERRQGRSLPVLAGRRRRRRVRSRCERHGREDRCEDGQGHLAHQAERRSVGGRRQRRHADRGRWPEGRRLCAGPDGKQLWTAKAPGEIISPPLVGNGLVVVRTVDGKIVAFNAQTGEQKWILRRSRACR